MQSKDYIFSFVDHLYSSRTLILIIIKFLHLFQLEYYNVVLFFSTIGLISILIIIYSLDSYKKNIFIVFN